MNISHDHNRIRVIDQFLDADTCQQFITNFELCHRHHERRTGDWVNLVELELWNFTHRAPTSALERAKRTQPYDWSAATDLLGEKIFRAAELYCSTWGSLDGVPLLPRDFSMEGMRIKCYRPNGLDEFRLHVDVAGAGSATRFVSFLLYLNDSDGGTEFPLEKLTVEAREGRLLIFPPLWTYPHLGQRPKDGATKYILSTYLHYL
jgi:hypothetical protein